jgi:MFS family permease
MNRRRVAVIIASFSTVLIGFGIRNSYGVLVPDMISALKISNAEAGLIYSFFFLAYTVSSPLLGLLADKINIRVVLTLFLVILGIGTLLMGYSSSKIEAILFFLIAGIGASACWSPIVQLVQQWSNEKRKGIILAFVDVGASLGTALSSVVIPLIVVAYDWRMGWKSLGIIAFFISLLNFFLVRAYPLETQQNLKVYQHMINHTGNTSISILKDNKFLLLGLSYLLTGFSTIIPYTFITAYGIQELGLQYKTAATLVTTIAVTSLVGKLMLGYLSDIVGRIKCVIICEIMIAIGSLGIIFSPSFMPLLLSMAIFGAGQGAIWPLYALCAPDYFSKSSTGLIVGLWTLFIGIGFMISPIIAGWMADVTGRFIWSFVLGLIAAIMSLALLLLVERKFLLPSFQPR